MNTKPLTAGCVALLILALLSDCQLRDASSPATRPGPGASQPAAPSPAQLTHRLKNDAVYYDNPAQARPPNGTMKKGTRLAVVQPSGSYTLVWTEDGTRGYVATDALELLLLRP
jgi:hypothetical protein